MKEHTDFFAMKTHHLKCWPEFFEPICEGTKNFEIRRNDRDYEVGDLLILEEWAPIVNDPECPRHRFNIADESCTCGTRGQYTGRTFYAGITYITDFAQQQGFVVMATKPVGGGRL